MLNSKEITVEVTNLCGSRCFSCPRETFTEPLRHMEMDLFKKIIDDAAAIGYNSLDTCGFGDPLLDPLLRERFEYVKENYPHMSIYTSTTCAKLNEKTLPWIVDTVDTLKISLFATSGPTYKKMHGAYEYEKVVENICSLVEAKAKHGNPYLIGLFLLSKDNEHEKNTWLDLWENKFDEVMVWKPHNWVEGREYRDATVKRRSCGRPEDGNLTVGVDGRVSICCFDYNKTVTLGDLKSESIERVKTQSKLLKEFHRVHETLDFANSDNLCKDCDQTFVGYDDTLVYASSEKRKVGAVTTHENLPVDMLREQRNKINQ